MSFLGMALADMLNCPDFSQDPATHFCLLVDVLRRRSTFGQHMVDFGELDQVVGKIGQ